MMGELYKEKNRRNNLIADSMDCPKESLMLGYRFLQF